MPPTDYDRGHKARIYVRKAPMPPPKIRQEREAPPPIKLAEVGFQHRRFPDEEKWPMQVIPAKVIE